MNEHTDEADDDTPIPAPLWERATSAATWTDVLISLARLDARVTILEQTITEWTGEE